MIIIYCDVVEKSAKRTIKICNRFCEKGIKNNITKNVLLMARYLEKMEPSFTAADLITINRRTFIILFSALTMYMIIIMQFNLSLNVKRY